MEELMLSQEINGSDVEDEAAAFISFLRLLYVSLLAWVSDDVSGVRWSGRAVVTRKPR